MSELEGGGSHFAASSGACPGHGPRVLLVARGFPPDSDPTSYRWLRFTGGLARLGWQVEVLTTEPTPKFEYFDPGLMKRIHAGVVVHRVHAGHFQPRVWRARFEKMRRAESVAGGQAGAAAPGGAPAAAETRAGSPRAMLRDLDERLHPFKIPDPTFEWIVPGVLHGVRALASRRFDLLVSSAAPFSSHVVAHRLQQWSRLPWVADFSDPYADNPFVTRSPWRRTVDRALERGWFGAMSGAIVPVAEMKTLFAKQHPEFPESRVHVVPYGFDGDLYAHTPPARFDGFTIVHTGTFYAGLRDPGPFFQALAVVRDLPIRVIHAGILQPDWTERLRQLGIADRFEVLGLLPREQIAPLQLGAACLLLIGNRGGLQLPGKLLDYLGARRPIFALRNDAHDIAASLVAMKRAGHLVDNEPEAIAKGLRLLYAWWKDGSLDSRFEHPGAPEYTWPHLEKELDRALRSHAIRPAPRGV